MNRRIFFLSIESQIFFFLLLVALFLNNFHYDEALIYQRIQNFTNFGQLVDDSNVKITFGLFFYKIFSKYPSIDNIYLSYYLLRSISFLAIILIFFIGKAIIVNYFNYSKTQSLFFYFFIFIWFGFFSGGLTSRHDALLSFTLLLCFYSYLEYFKNRKNLIYISLLISSLLISLHPFFILSALLSLIIFIIDFFKKKSLKKRIVLFLYLLFVFFISLQILIFKMLTIDNIILFLKQTTNYINLSNELSYESSLNLDGIILNIKKELINLHRLNHLYNFNKLNYYLFILSFLFSITLLFTQKKNLNNKLLFYFIFTIIIFLTVMPNKWAHHLSILVPFLFINLINVVPKYLNKNDYFKLSKNYLKLFFLIVIFCSYNLYSDLRNNHFFYNFVKLKSKDIAEYSIFNKVLEEERKIKLLNIRYKNLAFYSNPEHKYIFSNLKYAGHHLNIALKNNLSLIFLQKKFNQNCEINNNDIELKLVEEFKFENEIWIICKII